MTVTQLTMPVRRLVSFHSPRTSTPAASLVLTPAIVLLGGGLVMILSASWISAVRQGQGSFHFFVRQAGFAAVGTLAMVRAMRIDHRRWRAWGYLLYALALAGLIAVAAAGVVAGGSRRWIDVGPVRLQPSELAKLALVMVGAAILSRRPPRRLREVAWPYGVLAVPVFLLVLSQPDLGTTVILAGISLAVIHLAGTRARILALLGGSAVPLGILAAYLEPYRWQRLISYLNPFGSASTWGYQAVQARIALGEGGLFGVGLGQGRQKWAYVPNAHTDFIFAIIGEEAGLAGTLLVLGTFVFLAYAGVRTAHRAPDAFGRILAGGITAWIAGQAVINMGAVVGILPITGVPLPLVSFGGSSLVVTMAAIGILVSIANAEGRPAESPGGGTGAGEGARTRARRRSRVASAPRRRRALRG